MQQVSVNHESVSPSAFDETRRLIKNICLLRQTQLEKIPDVFKPLTDV